MYCVAEVLTFCVLVLCVTYSSKYRYTGQYVIARECSVDLRWTKGTNFSEKIVGFVTRDYIILVEFPP